jgi:hypothetical protein
MRGPLAAPSQNDEGRQGYDMETDPDLEAEVASPPVHKQDEQAMTLGVLLVHGIGTQRRGDTLLQAGDALQRWLRRWLQRDVELVETDVAAVGADSNTPAHSRVIFRDGTKISPTTLLLAECHWAAAFRVPTYRELVRWAWRIVPWTVLLHLAPRFGQGFELDQAMEEALEKSHVSGRTRRLFERYVGRPPRLIDGLVDRRDLLLVRARYLGTLFTTAFFAMGLAIGGIVSLIVLSLLLLVSLLLPFETVRKFARTVQLQLSATIGDSYLFLSSPLTASAILTRLHHDLNWLLAAGCDRIVIVAHSQGAAVAYDAIKRWAWLDPRETRLTHLITYGSGLRKLFALRAAEPASFHWTFFGFVAFGLSVVLLALAVGLASATSSMLGDFSGGTVLAVIGLLIAVLLVVLLIGGLLFGASRLAGSDPPLLDPEFNGPEWDDLYASHDPVPNGPIAVSRELDPFQELLETVRPNVRSAIDRFYDRQRQVTNRRSALSDHTSYWDCDDDFVARVATRLLELAGVRQGPLTQPWITFSAERRRWRVRFRNNLRTIAVFIGLMAVLAPRVAGPMGATVRQLFDGRTISLFGLTTWSLPAVFLPEWLFRTLVMLGVVAAAFLLADWGCKIWERVDRRQFFDNVGYTLAPMSWAAIGTGWLTAIASVPVAAALLDVGRADLRFDPLWPAVLAFVASAFTLWRASPLAGTPKGWALQLLDMGEAHLRTMNADSNDLEIARGAFEQSQSLLDHSHRKEHERAARGLAEVRERLSRPDPAAS